MHEIKTEYLARIVEYLAKRPFNEVNKLIEMVQTAKKISDDEEADDEK